MTPFRRRSPAVIAALGLALLVTAGCGIVDSERVAQRQFEVAAYKSGCQASGDQMCVQFRRPGEAEFGPMYTWPSGFGFEWGYEYLITVEERESPVLTADGSSIVRTLERVDSRVPVASGTNVESVVPSGWVLPLPPDRIRLFGEPIQIECGVDCEAVNSVEARWVLLQLSFGDDPAEPLDLRGWRACTGPFQASCE